MLKKCLMTHSNQIKEVIASAEKRQILEGIFRPITTASLRRACVRNDGIQIESLRTEGEDDIRVPTIIAHAANDPLASPVDAARLAGRIAGGRYMELSDGGHVFFVVHRESVVPEISNFLSKSAPGNFS